MAPRIKCLLMLALLPLAGACVQSSTLLTVRSDGSGTIIVREFFSPQITAMLGGMGDMMQELGDSMGLEAEGRVHAFTNDLQTLFKDSIEGKAALFGPNVTLDTSEERENDRGWKGYQATYRFTDINAVQLIVGELDPSGNSLADAAEGKPSYTFDFRAGPVATLKIVPARDAAGAAPDALAPEGEAMPEGLAEMGGGMMSQMLGPMLEGLRVSLFLAVEGEIEETNASFRNAQRPSVITLMDMPVDRMLDHPAALALLASQDPDAPRKLQALNIEGVQIEEPGKTISLSFK